MNYFKIPPTALSEDEVDDILTDLDMLNAHIRVTVEDLVLENLDIRAAVPAQFVEDIQALLDEWFGPIVDGVVKHD